MAIDTFDTPGDFVWTCPAHVYIVTLAEAWGAGADDGGGGGGYASVSNASVVPGTDYDVHVPAPADGDNAYIVLPVFPSAENGFSSGAGGVGFAGDVLNDGGSGEAGIGGGGGAGGSSGNGSDAASGVGGVGNDGGGNGGNTGVNGVHPGGGGGAGANGAAGRVRLTYTAFISFDLDDSGDSVVDPPLGAILDDSGDYAIDGPIGSVLEESGDYAIQSSLALAMVLSDSGDCRVGTALGAILSDSGDYAFGLPLGGSLEESGDYAYTLLGSPMEEAGDYSVSGNFTFGEAGNFGVRNDDKVGYAVYVGEDELPDLTKPPAAESPTLPITIPVTPPVSGSKTFFVIVRARNAYGLESQNQYPQLVTVDDGGVFILDEIAAPTAIMALANTVGNIRLLVTYPNFALDKYPATSWRVWIGTSPPDVEVDVFDFEFLVQGDTLGANLTGVYSSGVTYYIAVVLYRDTDNFQSDPIRTTVDIPATPIAPMPVLSGNQYP